MLGNNQTITMNCETDLLQYNRSMYGLLPSQEYIVDGCFYNDVSAVDTSCNNESEFESFFLINCNNQTNCSFLPETSFFLSTDECLTKINSKSYYVYFNAYCINEYLPLSGGYEIKKSYIPIIISFFDAAIVISYIFMLISLGVSQRKAIVNVLHNSLSPSLYSLELANLPIEIDKQTLIVKLWQHMEDVLNQAYKQYNKTFKVVDIQVAQKNSTINFMYKKGEIIKKVLFSFIKLLFIKMN